MWCGRHPGRDKFHAGTRRYADEGADSVGVSERRRQRAKPQAISSTASPAGETRARYRPSEEADRLNAGDRHRERGHHHAGRQRGSARELGTFT